MNCRARVDSVGDLVTEAHGLGEEVAGMLMGTMRPIPFECDVRDADAVREEVLDVFDVWIVESPELTESGSVEPGPVSDRWIRGADRL